jgi:hypothetical protein
LALGHRDLRLEAADLATFYRSRVARIMSAFLTIQVLGLFWFPPALVGGGPKWTSVNAFSFAGLQAWLLARMSSRANGGTWSISVELFLRAFSRRPAGHAACPPPIRDRPGRGLFGAGLQCAGVDRVRGRGKFLLQYRPLLPVAGIPPRYRHRPDARRSAAGRVARRLGPGRRPRARRPRSRESRLPLRPVDSRQFFSCRPSPP